MDRSAEGWATLCATRVNKRERDVFEGEIAGAVGRGGMWVFSNDADPGYLGFEIRDMNTDCVGWFLKELFTSGSHGMI